MTFAPKSARLMTKANTSLPRRTKAQTAGKPSAIQAVRDLLKSKDQLHQQRLAGGDLAARDARLITMAHVATALTLCLDQPQWGMVLRAELLLQVALAGRNSDCRQPLYKHLALRRYANLPPGVLDKANDAIGPHSAVAVIFNCAASKSAKGGVIENRSAVRYLHPDFCPVGATADYVMWDLAQPGRLCEENLLHCHLLRAPSSTGRQAMGGTELGKKMKKLLMDSGVKCDRTILPEGKHETKQGLKKLFGALCHLQNLDFTDQQLAMGHDRSTTEQSYLFTTALRTMFRWRVTGSASARSTTWGGGPCSHQPRCCLWPSRGWTSWRPGWRQIPELESSERSCSSCGWCSCRMPLSKSREKARPTWHISLSSKQSWPQSSHGSVTFQPFSSRLSQSLQL